MSQTRNHHEVTMSTATIRARRLPKITVCASLLLAVAIVFTIARLPHLIREMQSRGADNLGDFNFYYYAFTVVARHHLDAWLMYDHDHLIAFLQQAGVHEIDVHSFYGYPPQFAVFFSWLGLLDMTGAKIAWTVMSIVFLVLGIALTTRLAYRGDRKSVYVLLVAIALLSRPLLTELYWGQSNSLLLLLLAGTFYLIERDHRYAAGVLLGLAIVFKITPLAIAGLLLLRREWRTVISTAVCVLAMSAVTAMMVGGKVIVHYFTADLARLNAQLLLVHGGIAPFNSSVRGALGTLAASLHVPLPAAVPGTVSVVFAAIVCLLSAYLVLRRRADTRIDYALATTTILVASPVLESVHMVITIIPLLILIGTSFEAPGNVAVALSAFGRRGEALLMILVLVLMGLSPRYVTYTVAIVLLYVICVARYFAAPAHVQLTDADTLRLRRSY
jgi:hypothetical protein